MSGECALCNRLETGQGDPAFIWEFRSSRLYLGDHQFFEGYCVLVLKEHAREWHALGLEAQAEMWKDLAAATAAIEKAFSPWKINHASLGNMVGHLHWHIFPRYESDPDRLGHPWLRQDQFASRTPNPEERDALIQKIRAQLA